MTNKTTEALKYDILVLKIAARFLHKAVSAKERCDYWIVKELIAKKEMQLAEPVKQEPVGEVVLERMGVGDAQIVRFQMYGKIPPVGTKLYPAPVSAKREWVDLTDDELKAAMEVHQVGMSVRIGRIAIAAYKEKNK